MHERSNDERNRGGESKTQRNYALLMLEGMRPELQIPQLLIPRAHSTRTRLLFVLERIVPLSARFVRRNISRYLEADISVQALKTNKAAEGQTNTQDHQTKEDDR